MHVGKVLNSEIQNYLESRPILSTERNARIRQEIGKPIVGHM